jgi:hypothetical protein
MGKKKKVVIRIIKRATRRYSIEEQKRFLFWKYWTKGSPTLGLPKFFSRKNYARDEVYRRASAKGLDPEILFYA